MGKKRLVIDLDETQHLALVRKARSVEMTVSNYVRKVLGFPPEHQGRRTDLKKPQKSHPKAN